MKINVFILILLSFFIMSCDANNNNANNSNDAAILTGDSTVHADTTTDTLNDSTAQTEYPQTEYGTKVGSVIKNLTFKNPEKNTEVHLSDFYKKGKLILINSGAGWCSACKEEIPSLAYYYNTYHEQGLYVVYTLFQDSSFKPPSDAFVNGWKNKYNLPFDVLTDADIVLGNYYDAKNPPLNMLIRTSDMKIVYLKAGFDDAEIEAKIQTFIYH